jgi:GTP-binding protein
MKFVDYVTIRVKAGDGGRGCVSFRREKFVPKGGPDGGDGGRGGHVVVKASPQMHTLLDLKFHPINKAQKGEHGKGKKMHGKNGQDLIIPVPQGTIVIDEFTGEHLGDLTEEGEEIVVAQGGKGGLGNSHFATPTRQTPRFAQPGTKGEEKSLILELKLIADVGLVGLPNAGKSTFISVVSASKPKIADYPFTTLTPNLGMVKHGFTSFVIADIPGLIEGAHKGAGLGFQFLRHIQRTSLLLYLIDISETAVEDPIGSYQKILNELTLFDKTLLSKPMFVAGTKADISGSKEKLTSLARYCETHEIPFYLISSATGMGIKKLVAELAQHVDLIRKKTQ